MSAFITQKRALSLFREGKDTVQIARMIGVTEAEACELVAAGRRSKFQCCQNTESVKNGLARGNTPSGRQAAYLAQRAKPVTLPTLSFLEGKT